jgi:Tfp pilus assembly protein PilX
MFRYIHKRKADEAGQALILVLVLLALASLIIPALLSFISTGTKTNSTYSTKTAELYAADAGIQDGTWQIKSDNINNLRDLSNTTNYNRYDFTNIWSDMSVPSVNNKSVSVTIQNEWMPSNFDLPSSGLSTDDLKQIIDNAKLVVTGSTIGTNITANDGTTKISQYKISITYYPDAGETMTVNSIGVWLPPGCTYFSDAGHKSNFEGYSGSLHSVPVTSPWQGSNSTIWTFGSLPAFTDFETTTPPCVTGTMPLLMEATFYFQPPATHLDLKPQAVSWIIPGGTVASTIPVSWDADNRIFKLVSVSGQSTIDSYICKTETRTLSSAIGGDYYATGNSNLSAASGSYYRTIWHDPSTATVSSTNIPSNATVAAAYLYWSGWKSDSNINVSPFPDNCSNINTNWTAGAGSAWSSSSGHFQGHYDASHIVTDLDLTNGIDLSADKLGLVNLSWDQWYTSGSGSNSPTSAPASDTSDISGAWNSTGVNRFSQLSDALDTTYITQTAASGGYTYFGYTPSFSLPGNATGISVQVGYRASVPNPITFRAAGAALPGGTTAIQPALPAGLQPNDICIMVASTVAGGSITINNNGSITWNAMTGSPIDVSGGEKLYVWWGRYSSGNTNPTINASSDHIEARIAAWYNVSTDANPIDVSNFGTETTSDTSFSFATGISTTQNSEMCIAVCSTGYDITSTTQFTNMTNANLTSINERMDNTTSNGGGGGFALDEGSKSTAGTIGTWASTLSNASPKSYICFAFKPVASFPANVHSGLKINGTLYNGTDTGSAPTTVFNDYSYTYNTNPAGGAWTPAAVNSSLQAIGVNATMGVSISKIFITVTYTTPLSANDGLDFELYDGTTWSAAIQAFRYGDAGISTSAPSSNNFTYAINSNYLNSGFKIRFSLVGFSGTGQTVNIDDITLTARVADSSVVFKIDDGTNGLRQVYLDSGTDGIAGTSDDIAHTGATGLAASRCQVMQNFAGGTTPHGYSYSSYRDVTQLVQNYSKQPVAPATNVQGYATYSVGGIYSDTPSNEEWSYACWSIVIVYQSEDTLGHQLYLYDTFTNSNQDTTNGVNVDFDHDGQPGGTISGFIVPPQITGGVRSITLNNGGSGYTSTPTVTFIGNGTDARAEATINTTTHVVTGITIKNAGHDYTSAPIIQITGGGGTGAIATATIGDEVNVGKITTFVGEGDVWYTGDYLALNGTNLWDGVNCTDNSKANPDNIFNSTSMGLTTNDGIDVDTLGYDPPNGQYITWASHLLMPGDTTADINLVTHTDSWNLVYMIISFRSAATTGGSLSYLIH